MMFMKVNKCALVWIIFFFFRFDLSFSQQLKQTFNPVSIASPNAASIGQYGEIPVDYNTGVPKISIPLYVLNEGNLKVPISLNYHSAGIKPNQYPSWVGQNWSLFAGGAITRKVKGLPDEKDGQADNVLFTYNLGYFFNYNKLAGENWYIFTDDLIDTEPDEFSFNVNGLSGKFYLDHTGQWKVFCDQDIKVVCTIDDVKSINFENTNPLGRTGNMFYKFRLITEDGSQYIFGNNRPAIEFTRPESSINTKEIPTATTWNLTKIISPEGNDIIEFEYERSATDLILYTYYSFIFNDYTLNNVCTSSFGSPSWGSSIIEPSYLKLIRSKNQTILFNSVKSNALPLAINSLVVNKLDNSYQEPYRDIKSKYNRDAFYSFELMDLQKIGRKLESIDIYKNPLQSGSLHKTFVLKYVENNTERLKLQKLEEHAPGREDFISYAFEYYKTSVNLPGYDTKQIDHWGFFNNVTPQEPSCYTTDCYRNFVNTQAQQDNYYNSRNPSGNSNVYLADMLMKITYPTGGSTVFEYEPHDFSSFIKRIPSVSNNQIFGLSGIQVKSLTNKLIAGGLRIKKTTSSSSDNDGLVKEYFYVNGYTHDDTPTTLQGKLSSGLLATELPFKDVDCINQYYNCLESRDNCLNECAFTYRHDPDGYEICANSCPECYNNCFTDAISPYLKKGKYAHNYTVVGKFSYFTNNPILPLNDQNGNHITYETVIEKVTGNGYSVYKYNTSQFLDQLPVSWLNNSYYSDLTSRWLERNKLVSIESFKNNGVKVKEVNLYYNSLNTRYDQKIRTRSQFNHRLCNSNGYIFEYFGVSNYIYFFNSFLEKKIETIYSENGTNPFSTTIEYKYNDYRLLTEEKTTSSLGENLITTYRYPNEFLGDYITKSMLLLYHQINSPVEIVRKKNSKVIGAVVNKYLCKNCEFSPVNGGLYVNGFPKLSQTYELEINDGVTNYQNASASIVPDSRCKLKVTVDDYDNYGNVLHYHKANDIHSSFLWGYNQTYPVAKIENATIDQVKAVLGGSIPDLGSGGLSESQISALRSISGAMVTTYTYTPLFGMTSQTDPNGVTTYYEYDTFGRLKCIKDDDGRILKTYEYNYKQ